MPTDAGGAIAPQRTWAQKDGKGRSGEGRAGWKSMVDGRVDGKGVGGLRQPRPNTFKGGEERGREAAPVRSEARDMPAVMRVKACDNGAESSVEGRPSFRGGCCGPLACSLYYKDREVAAFA